MPALSNPTTCCSVVFAVPQASMVPVSNAGQPLQMQMVWMAPIGTPSAPGQLMLDPSVPSYDISGAAGVWSWTAQQAGPMQSFDTNSSWLSAEQVPLQLPMDGGFAQPGQQDQVFFQVPTDMAAWQAAPMVMLQPEDTNECASSEVKTSAYEEAPQQVHMDMMLPPVQEAEVEETENLGAVRAHVEADNSTAVSKSTLRRRRRQQAQMYHAEIQQLSASKEDERSVADADVADQEEADMDADALQAAEFADKVLEQLRAGDERMQKAIAGMESMAFRTKISCRAAQMALEKASANEAVALAWGMRGHVRSAVQSKYANYVIQKILETLPVSRTSFIVEELLGSGRDVSRHRFGCRILCRILEHSSLTEGATAQLIEEILAAVRDLCNHEFGSYVVRHILEFGLPEHRHEIASALLGLDVLSYSRERYGSHVVEAALKYCAAEDQQQLAQQLLSRKDELISLASNQFGHHVLRALLRATHGELRQEVVNEMRPCITKLQSLRYGKRVLQAFNAASN